MTVRTAPRFAPDATGEGSWGSTAYTVTIDGKEHTSDEARALGFVRESDQEMTTNRWVQADGFTVRGLFPRGDAQKFSPAELREVVLQFLARRGVEVKHSDALLFNYHPNRRCP